MQRGTRPIVTGLILLMSLAMLPAKASCGDRMRERFRLFLALHGEDLDWEDRMTQAFDRMLDLKAALGKIVHYQRKAADAVRELDEERLPRQAMPLSLAEIDRLEGAFAEAVSEVIRLVASAPDEDAVRSRREGLRQVLEWADSKRLEGRAILRLTPEDLDLLDGRSR